MKNIYQRINQLHKEVTSIHKDSTIKVTDRESYKTISYDGVIGLLHIPFAENGIVPIPDMKESSVSTFEKTKTWSGQSTTTTWYRADVKAKIKFVNCDDPNDFIESNADAYAFDTSDKAIGKAYTMALKSILVKMALLESLDEEEAREFDNAKYEQKPPITPIKKPVESKEVPKPSFNKDLGERIILTGQKFSGKKINAFNRKDLQIFVSELNEYVANNPDHKKVNVIKKDIENITAYLNKEQ